MCVCVCGGGGLEMGNMNDRLTVNLSLVPQ